MKPCLKRVDLIQKGLWSCCYGGQGCTAAHSVTSTSIDSAITSTGEDPKQEQHSEHTCQSESSNSSTSASRQDLFLLIQALSTGGFDVSVTAQATPRTKSHHSPSDTQEQSSLKTTECLDQKLRRLLGALYPYWISITDKERLSILRSLSRKQKREPREEIEPEARNRRY